MKKLKSIMTVIICMFTVVLSSTMGIEAATHSSYQVVSTDYRGAYKYSFRYDYILTYSGNTITGQSNASISRQTCNPLPPRGGTPCKVEVSQQGKYYITNKGYYTFRVNVYYKAGNAYQYLGSQTYTLDVKIPNTKKLSIDNNEDFDKEKVNDFKEFIDSELINTTIE